MKFEWDHINEDESVAKVGRWVLTARDMRRGWVGCIEHPCLVESPRVASREEAQAAAEALVVDLVAPFVEAEREACAQIAEARSRWAFDGDEQAAARGEAFAICAEIRARKDGAR